jgi:hypothetical protein
MIPKYTIEFSIDVKKHPKANCFSTDDPVACEQFLMELLERGFWVCGIKHEGLPLQRVEFDAMVKRAAGNLAAKQICASLRIKPDEEHYRFGFAA